MNTTAFSILSFLVNLAQRGRYESLIFISSPNPRQTFENEHRNLIAEVSKATLIPIISLTYSARVNLTEDFNRDFLTIVDLQTIAYIDILTTIAFILHLTTKTRVLLILDHEAPNAELLISIFKICWTKKLINVITIFRDFALNPEFYSYVPYPSFHLEKKPSSSDVIYPNRVADLKGSALKVFADQIAPLDMMVRHPNGEIELFGYVGHIITAFAKKHNAKLDYAIPYEVGKSVFFAGLRELLFNDTLDLLISMTILNVSFVIYSYTVEQTSYCMMVPVEKNVPTEQFYVVILDGQVLVLICCICSLISVLLVTVTYHLDKRKKIRLVDILLNDSCIRGLLSQSFNILKSSSTVLMFIYFLMSLMGMYFTTGYLAYLQTFFTHAPKLPKIETFSDLHRADFKVALYQREFERADYLLLEVLDPSVFKLIESYAEYLELVDNLNTNHSYMVPTSKRKIFEGKQKLFAEVLFRPSDMCVLIGAQMGFPIHPNSVLKDPLNLVIMQVQDGGILQHWMDRTFNELVLIGRMNFSDWTQSDRGFKPLRANDLWWVFAVFLAAQCFNCLMFVMELLIHRRKAPHRTGDLERSLNAIQELDETLKTD